MTEKIKVLVLNEPEGLNGITHWRMYTPMRMLERQYGNNLEIIWNRGHILPIDFERADIAIAWRPCTPAQLNALLQVKDAGIRIIIDYDDDILNVPSGSPAFNSYFPIRQQIKDILSLADMVWTSTERLKDVYNHPNTAVIPNAVLPEHIPAAPNPITKTVVWRGDFNQYEDVYAAMSEYYRIARKCEKFVWAGYMPTWEHPDNAEYLTWRSLNGYFSFLRTVRPNFVWKPMRKNIPFNLGKSNIAKIEAICAGGVALTNFSDMPTWEHSFREISWTESQIFGAWEAGRDQLLKEYNLVAWTDVRYRMINMVLENAANVSRLVYS